MVLSSRGQRSPSLACFGLPCSILTLRSMARKDILLLGRCQVPEPISSLWQSMRRGRSHKSLEHLGCAGYYHSGLLPTPLYRLSMRKRVTGLGSRTAGWVQISSCAVIQTNRNCFRVSSWPSHIPPKATQGLGEGSGLWLTCPQPSDIDL